MRASDFFTQSVERCSVCDLGDRSSAFLSCDECDRWFHMACAGVSASRVREEESFRYRECVEQVPEIGGEVEVFRFHYFGIYRRTSFPGSILPKTS